MQPGWKRDIPSKNKIQQSVAFSSKAPSCLLHGGVLWLEVHMESVEHMDEKSWSLFSEVRFQVLSGGIGSVLGVSVQAETLVKNQFPYLSDRSFRVQFKTACTNTRETAGHLLLKCAMVRIGGSGFPHKSGLVGVNCELGKGGFMDVECALFGVDQLFC